jgi:transcriptional regulator with XRE-family HTH domain
MVEALTVKHPDFGERLRRIAKKKEITIKDIAANVAGVTYEMARRYWHGYAKPRGQGMKALADFLGVRPAELEYGSSGETKGADADKEGKEQWLIELEDVVERLSSEGRQNVFLYAKFLRQRETSKDTKPSAPTKQGRKRRAIESSGRAAG